MNKLLFLIFIVILFASCNKEKQNNAETAVVIETGKEDSLTISIDMPGKSGMGLNVWLKPYDEFFLEFRNTTENDSVIIKKLPLIYDNYVILFTAIVPDANGKLKIGRKSYFIANQDNLDLELEFKFDSNEIEYKNNPLKNKITDSIYNSYRNLGLKFSAEGKENNNLFLTELDALYSGFNKITEGNKIDSQINEMLYLDEIQQLKPDDEKTDKFLKARQELFTGSPQLGLLFNYFKNNAEAINYEELNTRKYSSTYIELMAIGAYRFLKFEGNKGDPKYQNTVNWLKTTDFYNRDSIHINKQITPLNNEKFKSLLSSLTLLDLNSNQKSISEIIHENPAQYFLIDFWATWCAPCIAGIKIMNEMKIPSNVKVISLSVDREKDTEKWRKTTKKLLQKHSYWFDERLEENKGFTQFIEMKSIPRYILIDENMNLIDQAFDAPHEPPFLPKLKDVENHKYW